MSLSVWFSVFVAQMRCKCCVPRRRASCTTLASATLQAVFNGQPAVKFQVKGKYVCGNDKCRRSWSSAQALLLLTVQRGRGVLLFSVTALEQSCQRCGRDVYCRMYADEAGRVADWMQGEAPAASCRCAEHGGMAGALAVSGQGGKAVAQPACAPPNRCRCVGARGVS